MVYPAVLYLRLSLPPAAGDYSISCIHGIPNQLNQIDPCRSKLKKDAQVLQQQWVGERYKVNGVNGISDRIFKFSNRIVAIATLLNIFVDNKNWLRNLKEQISAQLLNF